MVENIYCFAHYKPLNLSYISRRQIANIWIVFFFEAFELDAFDANYSNGKNGQFTWFISEE